MLEVEVDLVSGVFDSIHGLDIGLVAKLCRDMVVEQNDVTRHFAKSVQLSVVDCDVDEDDERVLQLIEGKQIVVGSRDVASLGTPGTAHRPDRAESIGTAGVIETDSVHGFTIPN
jgi:hypothetical protein